MKWMYKNYDVSDCDIIGKISWFFFLIEVFIYNVLSIMSIFVWTFSIQD